MDVLDRPDKWTADNTNVFVLFTFKRVVFFSLFSMFTTAILSYIFMVFLLQLIYSFSASRPFFSPEYSGCDSCAFNK